VKWKLVLSCCFFGPHKSRERSEKNQSRGRKMGDELKESGREKKNENKLAE